MSQPISQNAPLAGSRRQPRSRDDHHSSLRERLPNTRYPPTPTRPRHARSRSRVGCQSGKQSHMHKGSTGARKPPKTVTLLVNNLITPINPSTTIDTRQRVGHSRMLNYASPHAPTPPTPSHISRRERELSTRPFQTRSPTGGLPRRRSGSPVENRSRRRFHPIHRQTGRPQSPNNPQHPQRQILARPTHHRQTRNSFRLPAVGLRTPQPLQVLLRPIQLGLKQSEKAERLPDGAVPLTPARRNRTTLGKGCLYPSVWLRLPKPTGQLQEQTSRRLAGGFPRFRVEGIPLVKRWLGSHGVRGGVLATTPDPGTQSAVSTHTTAFRTPTVARVL